MDNESTLKDNPVEFPISIELLRIFKFTTDESLFEKVKNVLSTGTIHFNNEDEFKLFLYFHKISIHLLELFENEFSEMSVNTIVEMGYYALCDDFTQSNSIDVNLVSSICWREYNSNYSSKSQSKHKSRTLNPDQPHVYFYLTTNKENSSKTKPVSIQIDSRFVYYGNITNGRLDIYIKAHILNEIFKNVSTSTPLVTFLNTMITDISKIISLGESKSHSFTHENYLEFVDIFVNKEKLIHSALKDLRNLLSIFQNLGFREKLKILERLFVQLLGHIEREVRNEVVILLNMLYDNTFWQEKSPFSPLIKEIGEKNIIELIIRKKDLSNNNDIICIVSQPRNMFNHKYSSHKVSASNINENYSHSDSIIMWIKIDKITPLPSNNFVKISFDLKSFQKCGYYDWNVVKFNDGKFSTLKHIPDLELINDLKEAKGRSIVINKSIQDLSIHEVYCDLTNSRIEKGVIVQRGNFQELENKLEEYNQRYINCLYIMGALERDNDITYDEESELIHINNYEASPMAITCRATVSKLLGGSKLFDSLVLKAKKFSIKIIVDMLTRISSSRYHRKYRSNLVSVIDEKGKINICYGTDGHSVNYEDSAILNYRKVESWDLLIQDVKTLANKHKIDGVHLDNCQSWPQILELDTHEMLRIDPDGQPAYSSMEILNGEIVVRNEDCGYWGSDAVSYNYPNPFLIKLTKKVWEEFPHFIFIGECWNTSEKFHNRHIVLARSGIIPRMYTLPRTLGEIFGRKIHRNGYIENCQPAAISIFKDWFYETTQSLPNNAVIVQSSCGQVWPYPALLHGRGNWAAVDLLFTLTGVPMTFMEEINGEAYRVQITNVYEQKDIPVLPRPSLKLNPKAKSVFDITMLNTERKPPKVNSLTSLSAIKIEDIKQIKAKQESIVKEVGPEYGFDLTKIKFHYDHRRKMRSVHECFRRGKLIFLNVFDAKNEPHYNVLAFARHSPEETGIIAINFNSSNTTFKLDLKPLIPVFENSSNSKINFNSVCYIDDWITEEKGEFYFVKEVINEAQSRTLAPFSSVCFGFHLIPNTRENFKRTMEKSISRIVGDINIKPSVYQSSFKKSDNYLISLQLKFILEKKLPLDEFLKWFYFTNLQLSRYNITFFDYFDSILFLRKNVDLGNLFFSYCRQLSNRFYSNILSRFINPIEIINHNKLGPVVFITGELGRWSTVGGLGIMVDELSQGLVQLGQDVIIITPYYEKNRKGETGYLKTDTVEFKYIGNLEVTLDQKYIFGIHFGVCNGVKLYFLHNFEIFPSTYSEGSVSFVLKQICLLSKAALELLCYINTLPAVLLTNDWFGCLASAYAKHGHFGNTFNGTTFFHIVHNLEEGFQGRLYPADNEGTLDQIHKLPNQVLIDPYWKNKVINPSRCALMMSDQWGTVSPSYRKDLCETSPLAPLLNNHKLPFAFPNGIFKKNRLKILTEKAGASHNEAKKALQKKYFGFENADYSIPLYSFVGRITEQKGVLLILTACETLIQRSMGKINIIIGGMGNMKDPYVIACTEKITYLRNKYPFNIWANPTEFFTDGPLVNLGSDFGLMPSLFEPGGIVQHEFFIAGTPVIAFKTGGLKDTVIEYDWGTNKGNGIVFEGHNLNDFVGAVERSISLFKNKEKYDMCRINAFNSAIDVLDVAKAWCKEFYRLRNKIYLNSDNSFGDAIQIECSDLDYNYYKFEDYIFLDEKFDDENNNIIEINNHKPHRKFSSSTDNTKVDEEVKIPITFNFLPETLHKPSSVQICGSFDKWQVRHPLTFDPLFGKWSVTRKIRKGIHFYKYIVDGEWVVNREDKISKDTSGNVNNFISI